MPEPGRGGGQPRAGVPGAGDGGTVGGLGKGSFRSVGTALDSTATKCGWEGSRVLEEVKVRRCFKFHRENKEL